MTRLGEIFFVPCAIFAIGSVLAVAQSSESGERKIDESFSTPTEVQGGSCSYVVYFDDGSMKSCVLGREDTLSGQPLPMGTIVFFTREGVMRDCFLQQDTEIQGLLLKGHSDNWSTSLFPSGKLQSGYLVEDQLIHGVPCMAASFWREFLGGRTRVLLYENGNVCSCKLAKEFTIEGRTLSRGDIVTFDENGKLMADVSK